MNNSKVTLASKSGTSTLVRAKFGPGMLLQHEDLEQLNLYTRDLSRLMFQSFFGCGVVCGLVVGTKEECGKLNVTVAAGVALACSGDPVYVPNFESFAINENCDPNIPSPLWVVLCSKTKCCAPRTAVCSPDDDEAQAECTREREGYEIRVVSERPACVCGCDEPKSENEVRVGQSECKCVRPYQEYFKCYDAHYDGKCGCNCDECSNSDCNCILLAKLTKSGELWKVDHRVRRFIRPVLMRDPQVEFEEKQRQSAATQGQIPQPPAPASQPRAARQQQQKAAQKRTPRLIKIP